MKEKRGLSKKKRRARGQKLENTHKWVNLKNFLENAGSWCEGEMWRRGGKTRIRPGRQAP